MPQSSRSHPAQQSQETRVLTPSPVWQQLPEPQRQQCHHLIAQLLTALVHNAQRKEPSHA